MLDYYILGSDLFDKNHRKIKFILMPQETKPKYAIREAILS